MFWNHKKQPNPGATLSPTLKLWQISARLYFDGDSEFEDGYNTAFGHARFLLEQYFGLGRWELGTPIAEQVKNLRRK